MFSAQAPLNAAQFEASLDRLLRAHPTHESELMDYSLQQAFRALTYAAVDSNTVYELAPQSRRQNPSLMIMKNTMSSIHTTANNNNNNNNNSNNNSPDSNNHKTTASSPPQPAPSSSKVMGREALWYGMCCRAVQSAENLQSLIFLSTKLLCDDATSYGEGNEKPYAGDAWSIALLSYGMSDRHAAIKSTGLHRAEPLSRPYLLGHLLLSIGTLRCLTTPQNGVTTKRLFEHYPELGETWFELLLPKVAVMADAAALPDQASQITSSTLANQPQEPPKKQEKEEEQASPTANPKPALPRPPSKLIAEANNFIIHSFFHLSADILVVHAGDGSGRGGASPRVLDRDPPQRIWSVLDVLQRALKRSIGWIEAEMALWREQWEREAEQQEQQEGNKQQNIDKSRAAVLKDHQPNASRRRRGGPTQQHIDLQLLGQVRTHIQESFTELTRKQEELHCVRERIREQYGDNAKDYHEVTQLMWGNTLRLCFAVQWVTEAYVRALGGVGFFAAPVRGGAGARSHGQLFHAPTPKHLLQFIGSCVAQVPNTVEEKPSETQQFTAHYVLLAAASTVAYSAPLRSMQRALWSADLDLTRQIQLALSQQCLRYPNPRVVQIASQLLGSIWSISVDSPLSTDFLSSTSEQLLDMLNQSRDAASHCVVELVSRAAVDRPHHFIPALFRLLEHGSRMARQNAMDVLAALPQVEAIEDECGPFPALPSSTAENSRPTDSEGQESHTALVDPSCATAKDNFLAATKKPVESRMRRLLRTLAEHLLLHLHDEELCLRLQGAELFSRVAAQDVVGPLLRLCVQPDSTGRRYNSASRALSAVVRPRTQSAGILVHVLEVCWDVLSDVTATAGSSSGATAMIGHSDVSDTSARPVVTAAAVVRDGDEPPDTAAAIAETSAPHHRPVPQSPGDLLPYAMLYSTESLPAPSGPLKKVTSANTGTADGETPTSSTTPASAPPPVSGSGEAARLAAKTERLQTIFKSLSQEWVDAVSAGSWDAMAHVKPLIECAMRVKEEDIAGQQFVVKAVLGVLHAISASTHSRHATFALTSSDDAGTSQGDGRSAVLAALSPYFEISPPVDTNQTTASSLAIVMEEGEWGPWLREWAALGELSDAKESQRKLYHCSFPLLCLRRCAPVWELSNLPVDLFLPCAKDKSDSPSSSETSSAALPTTGRVRGTLWCLQSIWESMWTALTHPALVPCATKWPEFVMVELEVLQQFPTALFLHRWEAARKALSRPPCSGMAPSSKSVPSSNATPSSGGKGLQMTPRAATSPRGVLFFYAMYMSFMTRVIVQRRSLILAPSSAAGLPTASMFTDPNVPSTMPCPVRALLAANDEEIEKWLEVPWRAWDTLILPWLSGETLSEGLGGAVVESERELDASMRRVCGAVCELFGALMMFGLAPVPSSVEPPPQSSGSTTSATGAEALNTDSAGASATGVRASSAAMAVCWWPTVQAVVLDPIRQLGEFYRACVTRKATSLQEAALALASEESGWRFITERFMMAMRIHEGFIQHFNHANVFAVGLLVRYLRLLAPLLIDTANAVALWCTFQSRTTKSQAASGPDECEAAAQCGTLLFKAVMLTSKLPSEAVSRYSMNASPNEGEQDQASRTRPVQFVQEVRDDPEGLQSLEKRMDGQCGGASRPSNALPLPQPPPQNLLELLGPSMVGPLASFALGCLRFSQSVSLQDTGVKLFSAVIGIAPEMVVSCDADVLHGATRAMEQIARLHPTPTTRRVAEQLLQYLPSSENS